MMRTIMACLIVCALAGCATTRAATAVQARKCFDINVLVTADDGSGRLVPPGVPIDITVRSIKGHVLHTGKSDADGKASFNVCWRDDDPAWQVEAQLRFGPQFVGALASFFNYTNTYCLTLPQRIGGHCGEWGSGPHALLPSPGP